jgi:predicted dehydrogenase
MFNQRTNPLYVELKQLIDSGELGGMRHTSWIITTWWRPAEYYKQSPWRATWGGEGGGVLVNQAPHQLDLWQWLCGRPQRCFARLGFGFHRDIATESEVNAVVDFGDNRSGTFTTSTHDMIGTDRLEILFDQGKVVVEDSSKVTVTRLVRPEQVISDELTWDQVSQAFTGGLDASGYATTQTTEYSSQWGSQHASVLENFAQHILNGTPLIADAHEGRNGVLLANAMQLSAWLDEDVDMVNFPAERYLTELNRRIAAEGKFPIRS